MKVLLINNCHFRRGGSEAVYFGTADLLRRMGHDVVFFSMEDDRNIHTDCPEYFVERGGKLSQMKDYFSNAKAARMLEQILAKETPDIAHVHLFFGGISPSIFSVLHRHGVPIVHTVHDYRMVCPAYTFRNGQGEVCEKCKGGKFVECFKGRCSKGSAVQSVLMATEIYYRNRKWHPAKELDGIIYVSNFAKQKHEEFDDKFKKTKNAVLYNFTTVGEKYQPVVKDGGYFLYYGRLSHEKGIETLIETFSRHPELKLMVVGTGPNEQELRRKNYPNINFLGYKNGSDLYNIVRNARFVCVPSEWYENNPMTIVEAYSMGVPVIGANIGGIPEIIKEGETGFLFKSGDGNSLDCILRQSILIPEQKYTLLKRNALRFAEVHFNSKIYSYKLVNFYEEIISNRINNNRK